MCHYPFKPLLADDVCYSVSGSRSSHAASSGITTVCFSKFAFRILPTPCYFHSEERVLSGTLTYSAQHSRRRSWEGEAQGWGIVHLLHRPTCAEEDWPEELATSFFLSSWGPEGTLVGGDRSCLVSMETYLPISSNDNRPSHQEVNVFLTSVAHLFSSSWERSLETGLLRRQWVTYLRCWEPVRLWADGDYTHRLPFSCCVGKTCMVTE